MLKKNWSRNVNADILGVEVQGRGHSVSIFSLIFFAAIYAKKKDLTTHGTREVPSVSIRLHFVCCHWDNAKWNR